MLLIKLKQFLHHKLIRLSKLSRSSSSSVQIDSAQFQKYISKLKQEYQQLKQTRNVKSETTKRLQYMEPVIQGLQQRDKIIENLSNVRSLENSEKDAEMLDLIKSEINTFKNELLEVDEEIVSSLLCDEQDNVSSIVFEVSAGVGGQEAMLFAKELFVMYSNYCNYKQCRVELAEYDTTDLGGLRHGTILVDGARIFKYLRYEAGVHRVQRVPATERSGRTHTSTVSISVLAQPEDVNISIADKDLKIETKKASGAGGQHVNTTDSAVRIVHLPTNISVECQTDRSQIKNREIALKRLKTKLYQIQIEQIDLQSRQERKSQVGSSLRNEKIRTYNYLQDRVTDHRIENGTTHNLRGYLLGDEVLDEFINDIRYKIKLKQLIDEINKFS